jgi:hypothetical protein
MCQQRIIFPAIPPGALGPSLRVSRPAQQKPAKTWNVNPAGIFTALRKFEHWNVVGQCLIPFLILAGALLAAAALRSKPPDQPVPAPAPAVDPATWEKMTQLAKIEQAVQERARWVNTAYANHRAAEQRRISLQQQYGAHLDAATAKSADQQSAHAAQELAAARQSFEKAMAQYQSLGGTVDYRRQLPQ